jgi:alpha-aminoadipate carrier protein LysW
MKKASCPECGGELSIPEDVVVGEIVSCPDCGQEYEVYELGEGGPKVRRAEVAAEDWGE